YPTVHGGQTVPRISALARLWLLLALALLRRRPPPDRERSPIQWLRALYSMPRRPPPLFQREHAHDAPRAAGGTGRLTTSRRAKLDSICATRGSRDSCVW